MSDDHDFPGSFSGVVRLFPLPNLVLFPHVVQPLHIFEPRYRAMLADALAGDRLLAMVLLRPGWEEDYHKAPPIHPVVCVGKVFNEERLPDGRYNLLLHGLARALFSEEIECDAPYRSARVRLVEEVPAPAAAEKVLRRQLREHMGQWYADQSIPLAHPLRQLLESATPLGTLCDIFTFALRMGVESKQRLLEEPRAEERARLLLKHLRLAPPPSAPPAQFSFPPGFSPN